MIIIKLLSIMSEAYGESRHNTPKFVDILIFEKTLFGLGASVVQV